MTCLVWVSWKAEGDAQDRSLDKLTAHWQQLALCSYDLEMVEAVAAGTSSFQTVIHHFQTSQTTFYINVAQKMQKA